MPPRHVLAHLLAAKLDFTDQRWLAQYLLARYPASVETNPSLPNDLAVQQLQLHLAKNTDLTPLLKGCVLPSEMYATVVEALSATQLLSFVEDQVPPTTGDLYALIRKDPSESTANIALFCDEQLGTNELTPVQQSVVRKRADPWYRIDWLSRQKALRESDRNNLRGWLAAPSTLTTAYHKGPHHRLVEHHREHSQFFISLDNDHLNTALAASRLTSSPLDQRRILGLRNLVPATLAQPTEGESVHTRLMYFVNNPHADELVLNEIREWLEECPRENSLHLAKSRAGHVTQALEARAKNFPVQLSTNEYDTLSNRDEIHVLVAHILRAHPLTPRWYDARLLLRNPRLSTDQRDVLTAFVAGNRTAIAHSRHIATPEERRLAFTTNKRVSWTDIAPLTVSSYQETVSQLHDTTSGLSREHAAYFLGKLGESDAAWDIFFALADSWDGSLEELVATTKNLA